MSGGARFGVVLAAAGSSTRFAQDGRSKKQFLEIGGRPILHRSLDVFAALEDVRSVVVVASEDDRRSIDHLLESWKPAERSRSAELSVRSVVGGARRQDSVLCGLKCLWDVVDAALVHDAARPLLTPGEVRAVIEAVQAHGAAVLGYPATDSIKRVDGEVVAESLDRRWIWQVQTPQGATCDLFRRAYAAVGDRDCTDEVTLLESIGVRPRLVLGSRENLKVTVPGDEALAEFLLSRRES